MTLEEIKWRLKWLKQQEDFDVQSLGLSKDRFKTKDDANRWIREHDFKIKEGAPDETENQWRYRQFAPSECVRDSERTFELDEGVNATGCKRRESSSLKEGGTMERKFLEVKASAVNAASMTVEGMATVKEVDRMGDLMLPTAFDDKLKTFMKNPVMAWCHNIMTIPPIGKVTDFQVREDGVHFKAKFDSDAFSKLIFGKYKSRSMRAFSVQFQPDEVREPNDEEKATFGESLKRLIVKAGLLEISCVPVPAVASALVGKSFANFDMKSFMSLTKEGVEGEGEGNQPSGAKRNLHERIDVAIEMVAQLTTQLNEILEAAGARDGEDEEPGDEDEEGGEGGEGGSGHEEEPTDQEVSAAFDNLGQVSKQLEEVNA